MGARAREEGESGQVEVTDGARPAQGRVSSGVRWIVLEVDARRFKARRVQSGRVQSAGSKQEGSKHGGFKARRVQSTKGSKHGGFEARGFEARRVQSTAGSKDGGFEARWVRRGRVPAGAGGSGFVTTTGSSRWFESRECDRRTSPSRRKSQDPRTSRQLVVTVISQSAGSEWCALHDSNVRPPGS